MDQPLAVIIEDDAVIADIFATAMTKAGYATELISDGQVALERIRSLTPDLVLLDLHLPGVPGARVLQAIRADERLKNTRVIITSADATLTQFLREEADLVLVKPIGFNQLRELALRLRNEPEA
jgi:DNA-binding response OmpR family regulator